MIWLLLFVAYVSVAVLLLNLNIASRWSLPVKLGAVAVVSVLYVATWFGLGALRGWATDEPMPDEFRLNWVQVNEPDKATGNPGTIYYWVRELDADGQPAAEPRSFVVPFDPVTASDAVKAQEELMSGAKMNGYLTRSLITPEQGQAEEADRAGGSGAGSEGTEAVRFEFRAAPAPSLPPKGVPAGAGTDGRTGG